MSSKKSVTRSDHCSYAIPTISRGKPRAWAFDACTPSKETWWVVLCAGGGEGVCVEDRSTCAVLVVAYYVGGLQQSACRVAADQEG